MSDRLILEYAVGGGRPPASSELLQIHRDGMATYLVGNALPRDEAGLYQVEILSAEVETLENFLSGQDFFETPETIGPIRPGSGFQTLTLYARNTTKTIKWGTFANLPGPLADLQTRLLKIIEDSRRHPVQTIKATLNAVHDKLEVGRVLQVECSLQSRGSESVEIFMFAAPDVQESDFRLYAATREEAENASPLTFYDQAQPVRFVEPVGSQMASPIKLSLGEEIKARAPCPFVVNHDNSRLFGFLEFTMVVTLNDELIKIRCLLMTKPTTLAF